MSTRSDELRAAIRAYLRYIRNEGDYDDHVARRSALCTKYGAGRVKRLYARYRPPSVVLAVAGSIVYRRLL